MTTEEQRARNSEKSRRYRRAHPEKVRESKRMCRLAHPEKINEKSREKSRKYRQAHPEKIRSSNLGWRQAHPEYFSKAARKYREAQPESIRSKIARRRASKVTSTPTWETSANLAAFERTRWVFAALQGVDESDVHADHVIPLRASRTINGKRTRVASGLHCVDNLTWKLAAENVRKGASLDHAERELNVAPFYEQVTYVTHH
jgi:hypothetical protein